MPARRRHHHRYFMLGGKVFRITEENRKKLLEEAASTKESNVDIDLTRFRASWVGNGTIEDWSNLSSAQAEALLNGLAPGHVTDDQKAIEKDAPVS